jgi:Do/DeqQ family serine protease
MGTTHTFGGATLALLLSSLMLSPAPVAAQRAAPPPTLAPIVKEVGPAVVSIGVQGKIAVAQNPLMNDPFFRQFFNVPPQPLEQEFHAAGSGVIVDADRGYVLTNNHVVQNAERITVHLSDGRQLDATVVGTDPASDVAVLKIPAQHLTALRLGDSDKLHVGDFVLAVGNPFGLGGTVTYGIVSAKGRTGLGIEGYEDFIQTDASINPGNSGGALVNLQGQLVGINTAIIGPSGGNVGIGLAIPINMARAVMEQLIKHGKIERGQLGVEVQDLTPELAKPLHIDVHRGALISRVEPGSPADKTGLKVGDVVVALDGEPVAGAADLRNKVGLKQAGQTVRVEVVRDGKRMTFITALASIAAERLEGGTLDKRLAGVVFGPTTEQPSRTNQLAGVAVVRAAEASSAYQEGLRQGDIITSVDRQPVTTLDGFARAVRAGSGDVLVFSVVRGTAAFFLVLR